MRALVRNEILKDRQTGTRWRLLTASRAENIAWLFEIDDPVAMPVKYPLSLLEDSKAFVKERPISRGENHKASPSEIKHRKTALEIIKPLLESNDIYRASLRSSMVDARATEMGVHRTTIYRYLRAWWRSGQNELALTARFKMCGHGKGTNGRGRKPVYGAAVFQMSDIDRKNIKAIVEKEFLRKPKNRLSDAYQVLLQEHYSFKDAEGRTLLLAIGERPSVRQFLYQVKKIFPKETQDRRRKGEREFNLTQRAVTGSIRLSVFTAGERFEIDATVADWHLVHKEDRSIIIGKPTIYLVKDTKTNLTAGWYVGMENASWISAQLAIFSIVQDKQALCKRLNILYDPNDWPADGILAKTIIADRGAEWLSNASHQLGDLGIDVKNLPASRADAKPHVEYGFQALQRHMLRSIIPGYDPPEDAGKRQQRDHSHSAALTVEEMERAIVLAIIALNRKSMSNYPLSKKQILAGFNASPINLWNWEIQERAGLLDRFPEEQLRFRLLPRIQAPVSRKGIRLLCLHYSSPEVMRYGWLTEKAGSRFTCTVSYDARFVDHIFVHDDRSPNGYFVAELTEASRQYKGDSFQEVEEFQKMLRQLAFEAKDEAQQIRFDLSLSVDPMVTYAVKATEQATKGKSRSSRKKEKVAARENTRRQERHTAMENDVLVQTEKTLSTSPAESSKVIPLRPVSNLANKVPDMYLDIIKK